jgi:hypothetical protein
MPDGFKTKVDKDGWRHCMSEPAHRLLLHFARLGMPAAQTFERLFGGRLRCRDHAHPAFWAGRSAWELLGHARSNADRSLVVLPVFARWISSYAIIAVIPQVPKSELFAGTQ